MPAMSTPTLSRMSLEETPSLRGLCTQQGLHLRSRNHIQLGQQHKTGQCPLQGKREVHPPPHHRCQLQPPLQHRARLSEGSRSSLPDLEILVEVWPHTQTC